MFGDIDVVWLVTRRGQRALPGRTACGRPPPHTEWSQQIYLSQGLCLGKNKNSAGKTSLVDLRGNWLDQSPITGLSPFGLRALPAPFPGCGTA